MAAQQGNVEMVKTLLKSNSNINAKNQVIGFFRMYSYEFGTGEDMDCVFIHSPITAPETTYWRSVISLYIQYFKTALIFATEAKPAQQLVKVLLDHKENVDVDAQETQVLGIVHG